MSEELKALLIRTYSVTEGKEEVTEALTRAYADPENLTQFMDIFVSSGDKTLRQAAIISFGKSVRKSWNAIAGSEIAQRIKQGLFEFFASEQDKLLLFNLVHAIEFLFGKEEWPELFEFLAQMSGGNPTQFDLCLYLSQYLIIKLEPEAFEANQQFFIEIATNGLQSENQDTIVYACGLASVLIYCTKAEENEAIMELFTLMITAFQNSMNDINLASRISARISFSFQAGDFHIPAQELIGQLLALFQNPELDPKFYVVICMLIEDLIQKCGKDIKEQLGDILTACLQATATVYTDDTLDMQEDFLYIPGAIEEACKSIRNRHFFDIFFETISSETPGEVAAGTYSFYRCIEYMNEAIMKNIEKIVDFLIERLNYEDSVCVQEASAMSMEEVAKLLQEGQDEVGNKMIQALIEKISEDFDTTNVISHCLDSLAKLLETSDINIEFVQPLLERLVEFIQNGVLISQTYNVVSNLVFSVGPQIVDFVQDLYPIIIEGAQVDENDDPTLKQNAIEALGNLLRFAGEQLQENFAECIGLFIETYETEDLELRSSVIVAIENLILVASPALEPFKEQIIEMVNAAIQHFEETSPEINGEEDIEDDEEEDGDNKVEKYAGEVRYIEDAVLMIKHIYKNAPFLIPEDQALWAQECLKMMDCGNEDIQVSATLASTYIWINLIKAGEAPDSIYEAAFKNLDAGGPLVVASAFRLFTHFIENEIVPGEEFFEQLLEKAVEQTNADYGDEMGQDELDVSAKLYKFWAIIATKFPNQFPLNRFIDNGKRILSSSGNFEKSQYLGVVRQLYFSGIEIGGLVKKILLRMFFENIDICDFSVIPEPIIAIKQLLDVQPEIVAPNLEAILENVCEKLEAEYDGEIHFYTTIADIISLLCSVMNKFTDSFDWDAIFPSMIAALPVRGDEMEAEHIYSSIIAAVQNSESAQAYSGDVLIGFAKTLAQTDQQIESYKLNSETYTALVQWTKQAIAQDGAEAAVNEALDEAALARLSSRLQ